MQAMNDIPNILLISYNYPPEVNALANRSSEHAREWVKAGSAVEVITDVPHFPEGAVHARYRNRLSRERIDGVDIMRVPQYIASNAGFVRRTLAFVSFMLSAVVYGTRVRNRPDVVVASSPQFFAAIAGWVIARTKRAAFVLEIRDLWPDSIVAVGALSRGRIVRMLEWLERFLYRKADHIVVVTQAFKRHIMRHGIPGDKITYIPNGVSLSRMFPEDSEPESVDSLAELESKFVVSYIGTVGMAHALETVVEAARACRDSDVFFLIVGSGSDRPRIESMIREQPPDNLVLLEKQPRARLRRLFALTNASLVHLRRHDVFKTVIPSKLLESMGMGIPVILGVEGESRDILLEAGAGIAITPEDPDALLAAVQTLKTDPEKCRRLGAAGRAHVAAHFSRDQLARRYWNLLATVANKSDSSRNRSTTGATN